MHTSLVQNIAQNTNDWQTVICTVYSMLYIIYILISIACVQMQKWTNIQVLQTSFHRRTLGKWLMIYVYRRTTATLDTRRTLPPRYHSPTISVATTPLDEDWAISVWAAGSKNTPFKTSLVWTKSSSESRIWSSFYVCDVYPSFNQVQPWFACSKSTCWLHLTE